MDLTREIQEAGLAYIGHVIRDIQGELQAHVGMHADFERVLLFGGGASFLKSSLPARNVEVLVLHLPMPGDFFCSARVTLRKRLLERINNKKRVYGISVNPCFYLVELIRIELTTS